MQFKKIQIIGAGAFVAFALVFATAQVVTPVASAAPTGYACCRATQDCPLGQSCSGAIRLCPPQMPAFTGSCVSVTPGPDSPTPIPGPLGD